MLTVVELKSRRGVNGRIGDEQKACEANGRGYRCIKLEGIKIRHIKEK